MQQNVSREGGGNGYNPFLSGLSCFMALNRDKQLWVRPELRVSNCRGRAAHAPRPIRRWATARGRQFSQTPKLPIAEATTARPCFRYWGGGVQELRNGRRLANDLGKNQRFRQTQRSRGASQGGWTEGNLERTRWRDRLTLVRYHISVKNNGALR